MLEVNNCLISEWMEPLFTNDSGLVRDLGPIRGYNGMISFIVRYQVCPQILFVGSSLNFSGTTSSDVRHTANEIKSSAGSSVQRRSFTWLLSGGERLSGISFCIIKCSLHCQVWKARRTFGADSRPTPPCAFYISVQSSRPMRFGHRYGLRIALPLCFTGLKQDTSERKEKRVEELCP